MLRYQRYPAGNSRGLMLRYHRYPAENSCGLMLRYQRYPAGNSCGLMLRYREISSWKIVWTDVEVPRDIQLETHVD